MIHLMELPNPDPLTGRPEHGGRDRHACIAIRDVSKLKDILDKAGKFALRLSSNSSFILLVLCLYIALTRLFRHSIYPQSIRKAGDFYQRSRC